MHLDSESPYFDFVCAADSSKSKQGNRVTQDFKSLAHIFFLEVSNRENMKVYLTFQESIDGHLVNISYLKKKSVLVMTEYCFFYSEITSSGLN